MAGSSVGDNYYDNRRRDESQPFCGNPSKEPRTQ